MSSDLARSRTSAGDRAIGWRGVVLLIMAAIGALALGAPPSGSARAREVDQVVVSIDATHTHQTIQGFGSFSSPLAFEDRDDLNPDQRRRMLDAAYNQVGLTMTTTDRLIRSQRGNNDPLTISWADFDASHVELIKNKVIDPARPFGLREYVIGPILNTGADLWLTELRSADYGGYLDEAAKEIVANAVYWRDHYGITPDFVMPFSEPLSGDALLANGTPADLVEITKRGGRALRAAGLRSVNLVVPSEETDEETLAEASYILDDREAAQYVGAIAYHAYPYGSTYASIPQILATSGAGAPDQARIAVRSQIRDLAHRHNCQVWMTEVSHGEVDALGYDDFRGRAIHIHDELAYADASVYFALAAGWDSDRQQYGHNRTPLRAQEGSVTLLDKNTNTLYIGGIGRAIRHYARWINPGNIRVNGDASDQLVLVTAFRDDDLGRLVLVAINNANSDRNLVINLTGINLSGSGVGELSTPEEYWKPFGPIDPSQGDTVSVTLPSLGVLSVMWPT